MTPFYYSLGGRLLGELTGSPASTSFFMTDGLGSVLATFNNTAGRAAMLGNQVYGPYGLQWYNQGAMGTTKGFTGQYNDTLTGLLYYTSRYYDPLSGRFAQADTVLTNAAGRDGYGYVGDNPETLNDPTGHFVAAEGGGGYYGGSSPSTMGAAAAVGPSLGSLPSGFLNQATSFSSCGGNTQADCLGGTWGALSQVSGYVDVPLTVGGNFGGGSPVCLSGFCIQTGGYSPGVTIHQHIFVSGTVVTPSEGCTSLLTCNAQNEGEGDRPTDGAEGVCSFTPKTAIATEHGKQSIGKLHSGDKVLAYNPKTHKMELQPIVHVWIHPDHDLVDLKITTMLSSHPGKPTGHIDEVVHTTSKHPFLTTEHGFLPAGKITVGMHVLRADGNIGVIIGWKIVPGTMVMYNLEVA